MNGESLCMWPAGYIESIFVENCCIFMRDDGFGLLSTNCFVSCLNS